MLLKAVCSDNEGEYTCPFEEHCSKHGIKNGRTVPKTPQQNRLVEKMNRTICEKVQSMLSYAKLPKIFWCEAVRTTADIINLSLAYALEMDVPEHTWTKKMSVTSM